MVGAGGANPEYTSANYAETNFFQYKKIWAKTLNKSVYVWKWMFEKSAGMVEFSYCWQQINMEFEKLLTP